MQNGQIQMKGLLKDLMCILASQGNSGIEGLVNQGIQWGQPTPFDGRYLRTFPLFLLNKNETKGQGKEALTQ